MVGGANARHPRRQPDRELQQAPGSGRVVAVELVDARPLLGEGGEGPARVDLARVQGQEPRPQGGLATRSSRRAGDEGWGDRLERVREALEGHARPREIPELGAPPCLEHTRLEARRRHVLDARDPSDGGRSVVRDLGQGARKIEDHPWRRLPASTGEARRAAQEIERAVMMPQERERAGEARERVDVRWRIPEGPLEELAGLVQQPLIEEHLGRPAQHREASLGALGPRLEVLDVGPRQSDLPATNVRLQPPPARQRERRTTRHRLIERPLRFHAHRETAELGPREGCQRGIGLASRRSPPRGSRSRGVSHRLEQRRPERAPIHRRLHVGEGAERGLAPLPNREVELGEAARNLQMAGRRGERLEVGATCATELTGRERALGLGHERRQLHGAHRSRRRLHRGTATLREQRRTVEIVIEAREAELARGGYAHACERQERPRELHRPALHDHGAPRRLAEGRGERHQHPQRRALRRLAEPEAPRVPRDEPQIAVERAHQHLEGQRPPLGGDPEEPAVLERDHRVVHDRRDHRAREARREPAPRGGSGDPHPQPVELSPTIAKRGHASRQIHRKAHTRERQRELLDEEGPQHLRAVELDAQLAACDQEAQPRPALAHDDALLALLRGHTDRQRGVGLRHADRSRGRSRPPRVPIADWRGDFSVSVFPCSSFSRGRSPARSRPQTPRRPQTREGGTCRLHREGWPVRPPLPGARLSSRPS